MIEIMIAEGVLAELDHSLIPNLSLVEDQSSLLGDVARALAPFTARNRPAVDTRPASAAISSPAGRPTVSRCGRRWPRCTNMAGAIWT